MSAFVVSIDRSGPAEGCVTPYGSSGEAAVSVDGSLLARAVGSDDGPMFGEDVAVVTALSRTERALAVAG